MRHDRLQSESQCGSNFCFIRDGGECAKCTKRCIWPCLLVVLSYAPLKVFAGKVTDIRPKTLNSSHDAAVAVAHNACNGVSTDIKQSANDRSKSTFERCGSRRLSGLKAVAPSKVSARAAQDESAEEITDAQKLILLVIAFGPMFIGIPNAFIDGQNAR